MRVGIKQLCDVRFEGIEDAVAWPTAPRLKAGTSQPFDDGLAMKTERASNLGAGEALPTVAIVDPGERLGVDYDHSLRGPASRRHNVRAACQPSHRVPRSGPRRREEPSSAKLVTLVASNQLRPKWGQVRTINSVQFQVRSTLP